MPEEPVVGNAVDIADRQEVVASRLGHGQPGAVRQVIDQAANGLLGLHGCPAAQPANLDMAALRRQGARDGRQQGALAHPVRAHDGHKFAFRHFHVHTGQHRHDAIVLHEVDDFDHGLFPPCRVVCRIIPAKEEKIRNVTPRNW